MLEIVGDKLHAGAVIAGAYRLDRILGQGGMGVVWEGVELATDRRVALKFLRGEREADSRNQERVLREARATMAIVHPNVAAVHAVLETDAGVPFLVMDVLVGETLRDRLARRGPMDPLQCARIMRPVASAIAAAHAQRIVHRDLKPDNIYLLREPPDDVRVIDFGIAKHLPHLESAPVETDAPAKPSLTSTGAVLGTPVYMAPEQIFGDDDIDGRADVWSLGIVMYECLTGRRPTDGEGFGRIIRRITTDPIEPLEHARPGLPDRLTTLVGKMLSRDRNARPSLDEIGAVLESLETRDVNAPPSAQPTIEMAPKRPARTWMLGASIAASVALASGGFIVWRAHANPVTAIVAPAASAVSSAPPTSSANGSEEPTHAMMDALAALKLRDGAACLRDLDAYDRSSLRGAFPSSSDPAGGLATRAMCTMLAGNCRDGTAMYRKWMEATTKGNAAVTPDVIDSSLDNVVGSYCEGNGLTAHERLLRAHVRLTDTGSGSWKASSADCKEWIATESELLPAAISADAADGSVAAMKANLGVDATQCYARAGDCKSALAAFRADFHGKGFDTNSPAENEKTLLASYDDDVRGTACFGKR